MDTVVRIFRDIGINESIFVMFPLILVVFLLLKTQLFRPLVKVMAERERVFSAADTGGKDGREKVEKITRSIEAEMRRSRNEGAALREKIKAEAEAARQAQLHGARERAAGEIARAERELAPVVEEARGKLRAQAQILASLIADRVAAGKTEGTR